MPLLTPAAVPLRGPFASVLLGEGDSISCRIWDRLMRLYSHWRAPKDKVRGCCLQLLQPAGGACTPALMQKAPLCCLPASSLLAWRANNLQKGASRSGGMRYVCCFANPFCALIKISCSPSVCKVRVTYVFLDFLIVIYWGSEPPLRSRCWCCFKWLRALLHPCARPPAAGGSGCSAVISVAFCRVT